MEQTLGKRIVCHRKRLGLTQDALAEKLGITAQAISKWENDLSCPDITMLPRLAEIFGVTTDELLGIDSATKVHDAEVVDDHEHGLHLENEDGKWEFHWDGGIRGRLLFPVWVLLLGILLLADNILALDIGFWGLAWPSWLLVMGLFSFQWFSLTGLGFTLVGAYFLAEHLGILPFALTGQIIWPAMVILFGLSLLLDALRKPKKPKFTIHKNGGNSKKTKWDCHNDGGGFECELAFGERTFSVVVPKLHHGDAECSFGTLTLDLTGCKAVSENCHVAAECSFGSLKILVPKRYTVQCSESSSFASISFSGNSDSEPAGIIYLDAAVSFGEISVEYV